MKYIIAAFFVCWSSSVDLFIGTPRQMTTTNVNFGAVWQSARQPHKARDPSRTHWRTSQRIDFYELFCEYEEKIQIYEHMYITEIETFI